jgi:hypothetical protein
MLGPLGKLAPLAGLLWHYLGDTRRRLAALHARFAAGRLPAAPRQRATPRPAADRAARMRRPPGIPRGPVFLQYGLGCFVSTLRELLEHSEMRALLAASPQAGRLLRPLWRKLTTEPLPEVLQLPRLTPAEPEAAAAPEAASAAPAKAAAPRAACTPAWWCPGPAAEPSASPPPWPPPLFPT